MCVNIQNIHLEVKCYVLNGSCLRLQYQMKKGGEQRIRDEEENEEKM